MLTGVILTLFIMLLLCTIFTNQDAASVSKLKARQPDKIQYLDDGMVLLSFNINRNESNNGFLVFFTSHQHVTVSTKNNEIYRLDDSGGIWGAYNRKCMEFCQTADICRNSHSQAGTLLSGNSRSN